MTAILSSPREQWLARRRELVTASDVAAILGFHPSRTAAAVYAEKLGHEQPETPAMRRGRAHEALIAQEYSETTGRMVRDLGAYEIQIHSDVPWLGATLDRVTRGYPTDAEGRVILSAMPLHPGPDVPLPAPWPAGPLEIKRHLGRAADWKSDIPLDVQVQLQVEIACYGATWGAAAAEISNGPIVHFDQELKPGFIESILPALDAFRERVRRRDPPEVTDAAADRWALKALFPDTDGRTVQLDAAGAALVDDLLAAGEAQAECRRAYDARRNQLERLMAGAEFAWTPDGRLLTRKRVGRKAYQVEEGEYIRLLVKRPRRRS